MGIRDLVNKFSAGELDPKLIAEVDFDGYRKACRKLRNVVCLPQAALTKRFGTIWQATIMNGLLFVTDPTQVRLIEYEFENGQIFDIIIRPDAINVVNFDIYLNGVFQTSLGAAANTYMAADIRNIRWVKDYDRLILLLPSVRPYELRVNTFPNMWSLNPIAFAWFPTFDFSYTDDPATLPTPNTPYWAAGVTFTPNATNATTITASTAVFTSNHVGGLFFGGLASEFADGSPVFRITAVNNAGTIATGFCLEDFADTSAIMGALTSLNERMWNDGQAIAGAPAGIVRGWPGYGCFYQSRLVLGGSSALPGVASGSNVKAYSDFNDSSADASFTWTVELGVTGNDIITGLMPTKSLILLGNKGPASSSILIDSPATPTTIFINTQGTEASRNMNGTFVDNQILYADRAGNTIWSMSYEIPDTGYDIQNASILSTHLIRDPVWADVFDPPEIDGRYYLLVNIDGTVGIYNTIRGENIRAWTLAQTTGSFVDVSCVANQAKVLARRKVNTGATIAGVPQGTYYCDDTFTVFTDISANLIFPNRQPVFQNDGGYILMGSEIPFTALMVNLFQLSSANAGLVFQFLTLNNAGQQVWETFTPVDGTNGFQNSGNITWTYDQISNIEAQTIQGTNTIFSELPNYYWIRIQATNTNLVVTPILLSLLINTADRIYLEQLSFDVYMDCTLNARSNSLGVIAGLPQLAGQDVFIFANDFPLGIFNVDSTGSVTIPTTSAVVSIGIETPPIVTPMPVIALLGNGISVYEPAHVKNLYVDYYSTLGLTVTGQNIPQVSPGNFMTTSVPTPDTNYYKVPTYGGWDPRAEFIISQSYPAPFTLLAVSFTVEVSP